MSFEKPILSYEHGEGGWLGFTKIRIYADGTVETEKGTATTEKISSTRGIPQSRVQSFVDYLVNLGFMSMDSEYIRHGVFDGWHDTLTLNYGGRSKAVRCSNKSPGPEYKQLVELLRKLAE